MKEKRFLLISLIFGILIAGVLLYYYKENKSLRAQAHEQTVQMARQEVLIDSLRRSGLGNMMSDIMSKVDDELKNNPDRNLSDERIASIVALCNLLKPYSFTPGDRANKYSPERGQILLMLLALNIDSVSFHKILSKASFSGAVMREADLRGADLSGVNLTGADLEDANLQGATMRNADLSFANLWGADLRNANLNGTIFRRANLKWADINEADLRNTNFNGADLTSAKLRNTQFPGATMIWSNATGALFNKANMDSIDLIGTNFTRANLGEANLHNANLARANLTETILTNTDLSNTELMKVVVSEENWLMLLNEWQVAGASEIQSKYTIVKDGSQDSIPYRIEKVEVMKAQ